MCHLNLAEIFETWEETFDCWISLCEDMHNKDAASNIRVVYNFVKMEEYAKTLGYRAILVPLRSSFDQGDALSLSQILYGCMLHFLAPSVRTFLSLKNPSRKSIRLDFYDNLKELIT